MHEEANPEGIFYFLFFIFYFLLIALMCLFVKPVKKGYNYAHNKTEEQCIPYPIHCKAVNEIIIN